MTDFCFYEYNKEKKKVIIMTTIIAPVIVAIISLIGTLSGSYFANKKSTALITYRIEQLEAKVGEQTELLERIHKLEQAQAICSQHIDIIYKKLERVDMHDDIK